MNGQYGYTKVPFVHVRHYGAYRSESAEKGRAKGGFSSARRRALSLPVSLPPAPWDEQEDEE